MIAPAARRTFRLASVVALSVALAYGLAMPLPFMAPLFAVLLTATPAPPPGPKALFMLLLLVAVTLGIGLVLNPLLRNYPVSAVMMIAAGLYVSTYLSVGKGKGLVGTLLAVGLTMIPAAGLMDFALASAVVNALLVGIAVTVLCQWLVQPLFPEPAPTSPAAKPAPDGNERAAWLALRTVLIVLPPVMLAFTNPGMYMPTIMKSVMLAQQGSTMSARAAGRELIGSTFLAGIYAMAFWFALKLLPNLWMFFLWMLLFGIHIGSRLYGVVANRHPPSFWVNVFVTMLILVGPAVQDSTGDDVYREFLARFTLFVLVTLYAWGAIVALEWLREGRGRRRTSPPMTSPAI
ncbi:DUF2955 domain-containing protein [Lysobacter arenosi]|uniref:DUF2955 domain-containing protein n=1 Tax=Lysobacter arenosi TaxID=2795387 RepID=A0ABX7RBS1_9GAMM|nr:DUF2955 domain-containing protein [Lysobacter arenosi]QSX75593.1 DUF2955 domain-containing protein [Lysobacter arenosi]